MQGSKHDSVPVSRLERLMEGVAFRTDLLALNAAIEATCLGKNAGGLSVARDPVRRLARKSGCEAPASPVVEFLADDRLPRGKRFRLDAEETDV